MIGKMGCIGSFIDKYLQGKFYRDEHSAYFVTSNRDKNQNPNSYNLTQNCLVETPLKPEGRMKEIEIRDLTSGEAQIYAWLEAATLRIALEEYRGVMPLPNIKL